MTALISGSTAGIANTSVDILGLQNGSAAIGQNQEKVYVNVATGNLVLQQQDEVLFGTGMPVSTLRTYNSQGAISGDGPDNWRIGFNRQLSGLSGALNASGSRITRVDADGSLQQYVWDAGAGRYVSKDGAGASNYLDYQGNRQWLWTEGATGITELYQGGDMSAPFLLQSRKDADGNTVSFSYNLSGRLSSVTSASGERTDLIYDTAPGRGANLMAVQTSIRDSASGAFRAQTRTRYAYDALNRLSIVTVDLSPEDNSIADGKVCTTRYGYDGNSRRISNLALSDGSGLSFGYDAAGRVTWIRDAQGALTRFVYDELYHVRTTVYDPLGKVTTFEYDAISKRLARILSPAVDGMLATRQFAYNDNGDLVRSVDGEGNAVEFQYDANGNQVLRRDAQGNLVRRSYDARNQLLTESLYLARDPGGLANGEPGPAMVTRYVYDATGRNRLRFVISAAGRVTEYRYNGSGQRISSIEYASNAWSAPDGSFAVPGEAQMAAWVAAIGDKSTTLRTDMRYDFRGQLAASTSYTAVDRAGNGVPAGAATTSYVYDSAGRLLQSIAPLGTSASSTRYVYDGLGREIMRVDALGQTTRTTYQDPLDSNGQERVTQTLADGSVTLSVYDRGGHPVSRSTSSSAGNGVTRYSYDSNGRLRLRVDASGLRGWLFYDDAGRKSAELDGNGGLTEFRYNRNDQVISVIRYARAANLGGLLLNPDGSASEAALAVSLDQVRPTADEQNDAISWKLYDVAGHLVKEIAASGAVTETAYDGAGRVASVTRYANLLDTRLFDAQPQLADIQPLPDLLRDRTTRYFYDADGRLRGTLDAESCLVETLYDGAGRAWQNIAYAIRSPGLPATGGTSGSTSINVLTLPSRLWPDVDDEAMLFALRPAASDDDIRRTTLYDARGLVSAEVDGAGYLTEYANDGNGNRIRAIRYATPLPGPALDGLQAGATLDAIRPAGSADDQVTRIEYDALGRKVLEVAADASQTRHEFDSLGNAIRDTSAFGSEDARTQTRRFDAAGNLLAELSGEGSAALAALGASATAAQVEAVWNQYGTRYQYDLAGRRTGMTDAAGNQTRYYHDASGRLAYQVNALGEVEGWTSDNMGRTIQHTRYATRIASALLPGLAGGLVDAALQNAISSSPQDSIRRYRYYRDDTLAASTDELGNITRYQYDAFGEQSVVTQAVTAGQAVVTLANYDRRGLRLSSVEDAPGVNAVRSWQYDAFQRVIASTDARGALTQHRYDTLGREVQGIAPDNVSRFTSYDAFNRVLRQTDGNGAATTWRYDTSARSITVTTPEGVRVVTLRNRQGEVVQLIDGRGNSSRYRYDRNGRLISSSNDALGSSEIHRYDNAGREIESIDARGVSTLTRYDAANRVLTRTVDPAGLALTTAWSYDAKARVVSLTAPDGSVTRTEYDSKGQVQAITRDAGGLNLVTRYSYDARGLRLSVTEASGTAAERKTVYTHDGLGRLVAETVDPEGLNQVIRYDRDAEGKLVRKTDALGNVTRYVLDDNGRTLYAIDPLGAVTGWVYDGEGRAISMTRYAIPITLEDLPMPLGASDIAARLTPDSADQVSRSVYDGDGRLAMEIDALNQATRNEYDGNGNLVRQTRYAIALPPDVLAGPLSVAGLSDALAAVSGADDRITRTVYDAANRAVYSISAMDTVTAWVRDAAGNVLREVAYARPMAIAGLPDANAMRDLLARMAAPGADRVTTHLLDAAGREVITLDSMGYITRREFDAAGRVLRLQRFANPYPVALAASLPALPALTAWLASGAGGSVITQGQSWDRAGRLVDSVDGMGVVTHRDYDAAGRVLEVTTAAGTPAKVRTRHEYDAAGRMVAQTEAAGTPAAATTRYRYDANGNQVAVIDARGVELAEQDSEWAMQQRALLGYVTPAGNARLAASLTAGERAALYKLYTTTRVFDSAARVVQEIDALGGVTGKRYDAFGNVIALTDPRGNTGTFGYDAAGHVIMQTDPEGHVTRTSYTRSGKIARVSQRAAAGVNAPANNAPVLMGPPGDGPGDAVTRFAYDKLDRLLQTTDAEGYQESYSYDALSNRIGLINKLGGFTACTWDLRGQQLSETLPISSMVGGQRLPVVNRFEYDAWGNRITQIEAAGLPEQRITRYAYDANGRQLQKTGEVLLLRDPLRGVVQASPVETQTRDARGNLVESTDANGHRTLSWYDQRDRKIAELGPDGALVLWRYDAGRQPIASIAFADPVPLPQVAGGAVPVPVNPANARQTRYSYDANDRLLATTVRDVSIGRYNPVNGQYQLTQGDIVTRQVFDAAGNVVLAIDGNGNPTTTWYDRLGQKILQVDAEGYGVAWRHDANGKVLQETRYATRASRRLDPAEDAGQIIANWPGAAEDRVSTYRYDRNGRLLEERRANVAYGTVGPGGLLDAAVDDAVTLYDWNGLGLMTRKTDANGDSIDISYDLQGRKVREQGAAFMDFQGILVRPTTDTEYDGLSNATASIRRGTNTGPGMEDQVTRYEYGPGARLMREIDPMGAVTAYDYDAAGNVVRKLRSRHDVDGAVVDDVTSYRYDARNREIEHTDAATGISQQTMYNVYGEVVGKGTNGGAQEFTEYDRAGRVFKSNSGTGVTHAFVYDAAGNATLKVESSRPDLRPMTLEQMLQVSNGSVRPDGKDAAGVHVTISAYDRRNLLTDTWQPKMAMSRSGAQLQSSTTTVQITGTSFSGTSVAIGASDVNASAVGQSGLIEDGRGISAKVVSGSVLETGSVYSALVTRFSVGYFCRVTVSLPAGVSAWGSGTTLVVANKYLNGNLAASKSWEFPDGQTSFDIAPATTGLSGYDAAMADPMILFPGDGGHGLVLSVYKRTPYGDILLSQSTRNIRPLSRAGGNWQLTQAAFNTPIQTPIPTLLLIRSANVSAAVMTLYVRAAGTTGPYQALSIPPYAINGNVINGWYALDGSALPAVASDVKLLALDAAGNIVDFREGSMNLADGSAGLTLAPASFGPASVGSFLFRVGHVLGVTAQGSNANSMIVRYRPAGSNAAWSTAVTVDAVPVPGNFSWNYGALAGDYEVVFETHTGANGSGDIINKLYGSVRLNDSAPALLTGLTPYQHRPSTIRFDGNPLDATVMTVRYRPLGSNSPYTSVTLTPGTAGSGSFLWDASGLAPYEQSAFRYEFDYEVVNVAGQVVNKGGGSLQLGSSPAILSQYVTPRTPILGFIPPDPAGVRMQVYYRLRNSTGGYGEPVQLARMADGRFSWDVSALAAASGSLDYEYFYDLFDAAGSGLGRTFGYFTVGATGSANELRWVIGGVSTDAAAIHRRQQGNAFGEVAQETDGLGHTTDYRYNTLGYLSARIASQTSATLENGYIRSLRPTTLYTHDRIGQLVAEQDPNGMLGTQAWMPGNVHQFALVRHADGSGMKNQVDVFGNLRSALDELGRETNYVYDRANRLVRVVRPSRNPASPSATSFAGYDFYEYDENGNRIAHTNALGLRERAWFDSLGRVVRTVSHEGRETRYDYRYSASLTGLGGATVNGFIRTTTDANGRSMVDSNDSFSRLLAHQDLGGHSFRYAYNYAGWLIAQTGSSGQDISYEYYANGFLRGIRDRSAHTLTSYEYDAEGNKTFEGYALLADDNQAVRDFAQQASITYDALNRVQRVVDPRYSISYEYDAAGNRRHMQAVYHDGLNGSLQTQDYWYRYDPMNRFTLTMGSLSGARATREDDASVAIVLGRDGVQLAYDVGGQRRQAVHYGDDGALHVEQYSYTADGYLEDTVIDGVLRARRRNDAFGRVISYSEYSAAGVLTYQRSTGYDGDNLVKSETDNRGQVTTYYRYADGTLEHSSTQASGTTTTTYYGYEWWDSAKQSTITAQPYNASAPGWKSGTSHLLYDVNGHLKEARDEAGRTGFVYVTNAQGLILRREEAMPNQVRLQNYYYLDGKRIGDVGNGGPSRLDYVQALAHDFTAERKPGYRSFRPISSADFDQNYEPISPSYPGATATSYVVKAGDSLRSISALLWGDPSMWYLIADANGLVGNESLTPGTSLTIPNKVTNIHNNHETFRVYNPGEAIGDVSPTVPEPPPPPASSGGGCGGLGQILVAIVAVVATVFTAGVLAAPAGSGLGAIFSAGAGALANGAIGTAALAGAVSSVASQAVGIALGVQEGFSWAGVGLAALGAAAGAGLGASGIGTRVAGALGITSRAGQAALSSVLANGLTQGLSVVTGLRQKFDWRGIAASALGAAAGSVAGSLVGAGQGFGSRLAAGLASGGARALVAGNGFDWSSLTSDTLGGVLIERLSAEEPAPSGVMSFADDMALRRAASYWNPTPAANEAIDADADVAPGTAQGAPGISDSASLAEITQYQMERSGFGRNWSMRDISADAASAEAGDAAIDADSRYRARQADASDFETYRQAEAGMGRLNLNRIFRPEDTRHFVLSAFLDGTWNKRGDGGLQDTRPGIDSTNVGLLQWLSEGQSGNFISRYYEGVGTDWYSKHLGGATGAGGALRVASAYQWLADQANEIRQRVPDASFDFMAVGFSRGALQARMLLRMVDERGIPDYSSGYEVQVGESRTEVRYERYIVPPGAANLNAVLFDTVTTGIGDFRNIDLPARAQVYHPVARDEMRDLFPSAPLGKTGEALSASWYQPVLPGDHSDIGNNHDRGGLGDWNLKLAHQFMTQQLGLPLAPIPAAYQPQPDKAWIHDMSGRKGMLPPSGTPFTRPLAPRYAPRRQQDAYAA